MKVFNIDDLFASYSEHVGEYVCVEGYYDGKNIKNNNLEEALIVDDNKHFHSTLTQLLKKIGLSSYVGGIRVIGKLGVGMTNRANIGQIIKVEILNDDGKFQKSAMINSDSIPKDIRDQI